MESAGTPSDERKSSTRTIQWVRLERWALSQKKPSVLSITSNLAIPEPFSQLSLQHEHHALTTILEAWSPTLQL